MLHVAEDELHAYLDGETAGAGGADEAERQEIEAHLAACAECSAKLEEVRHLRDRASDILASSGPVGITTPPFEDVVAQSRRERTRRVVKLNRLQAVAWAATIVLALGVGWYARGSFRPSEQSTVPAMDRFADSLAPLGVERQDVAAGAGAQVPDAPELTPQVATTRAAETKAQLTPADALRMAETEVSKEAQPVAQAAAPAPAEDVAIAGAVQVADARARELAGADSGLRAERDAVQRRVARAADEEPARGVLADTDWQVVNEPDAETFLPDSVAKVEGLAVRSYAVRTKDGRRAVRVQQELGSGTVLELVQEQAEAPEQEELRQQQVPQNAAAGRLDASVVSRPADSVTVVTVRRGNYLITARAKIPLDSLLFLVRLIP